MITAEQVANLRKGDVVEVSGYPTLNGATVRGPLRAGDGQRLSVGVYIVRHRDGTPPTQYEDDSDFTLTVVSRAPRPLYVNHPRTEPVPGDVVRDADSDGSDVWIYAPLSDDPHHWRGPTKAAWITTRRGGPDDGISRVRSHLPARLRLLVDGDTGQVVPS